MNPLAVPMLFRSPSQLRFGSGGGRRPGGLPRYLIEVDPGRKTRKEIDELHCFLRSTRRGPGHVPGMREP